MDIIDAIETSPLGHEGDVPLWRQLELRIVRLIAVGALVDGSILPSERVLASRLGLSRATIRRCMEELEAEGHAVRRRGSGTFVRVSADSSSGIARALNFSGEIRAQGRKPSSRVLGFHSVGSKAGVSRRLRVPDGSSVWEIRRVRLADEKPILLETAYVPVSLCPELSREDLDRSLYESIAAGSGALPACAEEIYEAILLDKREADALEVQAGTPALRTLRTSFDDRGRAFEASVLIGPADRYRLSVTLDEGGGRFRKLI